MTSRNLSVREEVYRKLVLEKHKNESFSDVIERLLERRGSLLPLWGALAHTTRFTEMQDDIEKTRKTAVIRSR